jgi:phosphohistidine phosphatase
MDEPTPVTAEAAGYKVAPPSKTRPRRLVLLRHGKAEAGRVEEDAARSLAVTGREQLLRTAAALITRGLSPDLVLCSSAARTRQTWELIRSGLGEIEPEVFVEPWLYGGGAVEIMDQLREVSDRVRTVLVVGHEPALSRTAVRLAGAGSDEAVLARTRLGIPAGTFLVLEVDGPWAELEHHRARLRTVVLTTARATL